MLTLARYVLKRIVFMLVALWVIATITFFMMHSIPGGPFTSDRKLAPAVESALQAKYQLDQPLLVQYGNYMLGLLRLDFGPSFKYEGMQVNDLISAGFPISAELGLFTIGFALLIALPLSIIAALKTGRWQDFATMTVATIGVALPSFVIATLLLYVFSLKLGVLPAYGLDSPNAYILPVIAGAGFALAFITRLGRASLLEELGRDYIRTAKAKGLRPSVIVVRHAMRNAMIPVLAILGPILAGLITGSFVIEKIFAIPGLGQQYVNSISNRDYTAIMGITVFYAAILITMMFLIDILYSLIDPRIKLK